MRLIFVVAMFRKAIVPLVLFISCITAFFTDLSGQANFEVEAGILGAGNRQPLEIWEKQVETDVSLGMYARLGYSYFLNPSKIQPVILVGYKFLHVEGRAENWWYSGISHRVSLDLGCRYWPLKDWGVGTLFHIENNLDFEEWRTSTNDLLRYAWSGCVLYRVSKDFKILTSYRSAVYPRFNQYFLYNPQHQVLLGLNYRLL